MTDRQPDPPADVAQAAGMARSGAAQRTIAVVGDAWTLRILRSVFRGRRRHGEFVAEFGVSRAVLSDRLAKLVAHGVLERQAQAGRHPEYRLSDRGLDLWSLFLAMWQWEMDWGTAKDPDTWAPDLPRPTLTHTTCGQAMRPALRCMACRAPVLPFDTRAEGGASEAALAQDGAAGSAFRKARGWAGEHPRRLSRIIGDRWNCAVVAAAFRGTRLFARFQQELQIGPTQLSDRLAELQELGILRARAYAGTRQEYRLTQAGIALFPMTLELVRWGNRWLAAGEDPLVVRHLPCGELLDARWHCGHCGETLARETVRFG
ncbi:MAG: helix-turn-helix domain-containing protein [Rhodoferax sp.]